MHSRRTLTLTLSLLQREAEIFGGTLSVSPNRDPRQVRTSSPRSERAEEQGEGRFGLHCYGQDAECLRLRFKPSTLRGLTASRRHGQSLLVLFARHQHALFLVGLEHEVRRGREHSLNGR